MILLDILLFKDSDPVFFGIRIWVAEKSRILWIRIRNTAPMDDLSLFPKTLVYDAPNYTEIT